MVSRRGFPTVLSAWLHLFLVAAGLLAGAATIAGFFGSLWWPLDLLAHFRVQYLLGLALVVAAAALLRRWRSVAIFSLLAIPNLVVIAPLYFGPAAGSAERASPTITAMLANVNTGSGDAGRLLAVIAEYDPDLVVLEEIDGEWADRLAPLEQTHPHVVLRPRWDNFGIGLYSKRPLASAKIVTLGEADVPSVFATLDLEGRLVHVLGTHPVPPGNRQYVLWRDEQLERVAEFVNADRRPLLLLGDLNVTPWSFHYRRLLDRTGLIDSTRGRGVKPTWPANLPLLWIPIDHCLHSDDIVIESRETGPDIGSDHYPVIVRFHLVGPT
ncbi:MAG: endonuclease/exonuclease/phosphatase family protein [Planctomycetota bacterium]